MFGLVFVSDGQNDGPLTTALILIVAACSPLVWNSLDLLHMYKYLNDNSISMHPH